MTTTNGRGEKLSRRREVALAALLSEVTVKAAAAKAKVGERTLRDWMKEPTFASEYRQRRHEVLDAAVAELQSTMTEAARTLKDGLGSEKAGDRLRAASAILAFGLKFHELLSLAEQLERVERRLKELAT